MRAGLREIIGVSWWLGTLNSPVIENKFLSKRGGL